MMEMVSSSERGSARRWRYTWEALGHIPTLRLFLFSPEVEPLHVCENLEASLCSGESRLVVKWMEEGVGNLELRVPVPTVLIDPVAPVQALARKDHIEVKVVLVLPLDHPMSMDSRAALDDVELVRNREGVLPFSFDSDKKHLSTGDVHFYCKNCQTRLTKRPSRKFLELPSADWRDVADNWFGAGCCSFGGISEKLVREYTKSYSCPVSTCLLDGPSVTICKDDLEGYEFPHDNMSDVIDDTYEDISPQNFDISHDSSLDQVFSKESLHCCDDARKNHLNQAYILSSSNVALGSGFLVKSCNLSKKVRWIEVSCRECSSLLGSYPVTKGVNDPVDGGIRLFKCYVSTSIDHDGSDNVFRKHTLQRIFARLLLESAADEISFHTVVKDLNTRSPILQIVLLNSKVWCFSGESLENEPSSCLSKKVDLQPAVKVLFSDCASRTMEEWLTRRDADEVFMLTRQTEELMESLNSAHKFLPLSCSSFQGMSLSYIERWNASGVGPRDDQKKTGSQLRGRKSDGLSPVPLPRIFSPCKTSFGLKFNSRTRTR